MYINSSTGEEEETEKKRRKNDCEFDLFAVETPKFDQGHPEIRSGSPRLVYIYMMLQSSSSYYNLIGYYPAEIERAYLKNSSFTRVRK